MKNINEKKTHCVNHGDNNYSLIGMRREQPIGWWLKKLFKSFNIDVITNPYIYEEYVRTEGKGPDFLIPDLGIAIEAKGLSKYLKNGDKQYVSREWLIREVIGGEVKEKGKIKLYSSRYPVGYNNKHVIFQWGSTCPQKHVDWMSDKHDIITLSPNIDLDHIWKNKHDLMKLKRFLYRNFVAPYKSLLKKINNLRDKWGDEWRLHYNLNLIRYKSNTLSSYLTRDNYTIHTNANIIDSIRCNIKYIDKKLDKFRLIDIFYSIGRLVKPEKRTYTIALRNLDLDGKPLKQEKKDKKEIWNF